MAAGVPVVKQELPDEPSALGSLVNLAFEAICEGQGHPQDWLEKRIAGFEVDTAVAITLVVEIWFMQLSKPHAHSM